MKQILNFIVKFYFHIFKFFLKMGRKLGSKIPIKVSQTLKGGLILVGGKKIAIPSIPGLAKFIASKIPAAISAAGLISLVISIFNYVKDLLGFDGDENDVIEALKKEADALGLSKEFGSILDAYNSGDEENDSLTVSVEASFSVDINGDGVVSHQEYMLVQQLGRVINKVDSNVLLMLQLIHENDFDLVNTLKFFRRYKDVSKY